MHDASLKASKPRIIERYVPKNILNIIRTKRADAAFCCSCGDISIYWMNLYVLYWSSKFFEQHIKKVYLNLRANSLVGGTEQAFRVKFGSKKVA